MNLKRAQAAVEYLSTYGWAVLVIALVLAALVWLGVFNVASDVPDVCQFPIGTLTCKDVKIAKNPDGKIELESITLRNDFDKAVYICAIGCDMREPDPDTGWPKPPHEDDDALCGSGGLVITTGPALQLLPGEEKTFVYPTAGSSATLTDPLFTCTDAAGRMDSFDVGDRYAGTIYVHYGFTYFDRIVEGEVVTTVQPPIFS
ncbi:hypothetical protein DRN67_03720 [Candidatus Micrarchaeota archaeon]|nr:MAG: hypothetical protein DRN67_03720 [Candidatus Micrarchaeota archaeon]